MVAPDTASPSGSMARDHGFHTVQVRRVVPETAEASSLVLDVPADLASTFRYSAGQFCTFRVRIDGDVLLRSYSMSSAPAVDDELRVTVKRVPGGRVSNHLLDVLDAGAEVEVTPPAGVFCLPDGGGDFVAYAAGSGITPVISLVKEALATTERSVVLLYANRDREATIFAADLDRLTADHPGRLVVRHHHDVDAGFVDAAAVRAALGDRAATAEVFVCGPGPFMDLAEAALLGAGVAPDRIHIERFTPAADGAGEEAAPSAPAGTQVTIELDGTKGTTAHHAGTTILQAARQMGMAAPSSCEAGSCATCMARLVEGTVRMHVNDVLTDEEVGEGWVLTCQSVPTSPSVSVVYGFD